MRVTARLDLAAPLLIAGAETTADLASGTAAEGHVGRHAGLRLDGLCVLFYGVSHLGEVWMRRGAVMEGFEKR